MSSSRSLPPHRHDHGAGAHAAHGHTAGGEGAAGQEAVIARAERYGATQGTAFTAGRRRVLEALLAAGKPLSAYDLAERLSAGGRRVAPVQVYRSLDFLMAAGVVHRIATRSTFITCDHEHGRGETIVFLVCEGCGGVAEVASPTVGRGLRGAAESTGFRPLNPVVEVEGRCAACQD